MHTHGLDSDTALQTLIGRAHRRSLAHSAMAEVCTVGAVFLLGLALLLVAGSDYFPISLLWLCAAFGLGAAIYRWVRERATPYQIAQRLDSRWSTHDQISTAYHFLDHEASSARAAGAQRLLAEEASRMQDVSRALPFQLPGSARWLLALALLTTSLWILRYLFHPGLTLQPPLPALVAQAFFAGRNEDPSPRPTSADEKLPDSSPAEVDGRLNQTAVDLPEGHAVPLGGADESGQELAGAGQHQPADPPSGGDPVPDQGASVESMTGTDSLSPYQVRQASQPGTATALAAAPSDGDLSQWAPPPGSLLERLQELLQSMLAPADREAADRAGIPSGASPPAAPGRRRRPGGAQHTPNSPNSAAGGDQQSSIAPAAISRIDVGSGHPMGQDKTKIGTAGQGEGSKQTSPFADPAVQFAQLAELYQRRTEEIRGAFTIEATSSRQRAGALYLPKKARHHGAGGAVSRDEIPLRYRPYIKEYFKRIQ